MRERYSEGKSQMDKERIEKIPRVIITSCVSAAIAPNATLEQLQSKTWLTARLPKLQKDFKNAN